MRDLKKILKNYNEHVDARIIPFYHKKYIDFLNRLSQVTQGFENLKYMLLMNVAWILGILLHRVTSNFYVQIDISVSEDMILI